MGMVQQLLKQYDQTDLMDLSQEESDAFFKLLADTEQKELTFDKFKIVLSDMIVGLEGELISTDEFEYFFFGTFKRVNRKQIYLKARLHNYLTLKNIIEQPEKARRALQEALDRVAAKKSLDGNTNGA
jgi:hypothetical protein